MEFTDSDELRRDILANQYLPEHLRERAKNDTSEYCRAEDADNLLEIDRLAGHGLVRFHFESGNASMRMLAPKLPAGASPVLHSDMGWQYRHPWWRERLGELEDGDPFYIKVMGNTLAYRVTSKRIVSPTDTKSLRVHKGKDEVTLLTCTGQGNTLRLLVTGERNSMPDQAPLPGDATGDVKKAAFVSGVTVTGILAVGFSLCRSRRAVGHHIGLPQTHDSNNLR